MRRWRLGFWILYPLGVDRWSSFFAIAERDQPYVAHIGIGWALARLPWSRRNPERYLSKFSPLMRWLVMDGFGFHEGYFHSLRSIRTPHNRPKFSAYANRVFDQGLGRSLWFVEGADVEQIADTIASFHGTRHSDLWSGVGLACAYAGSANFADITALRQHADRYESCLAQGAAFAAKARKLAGIPADHTTMACEVLCGMSADSAARLTDECRVDLPDDGIEPSFECWRQRIQSRLAQESVASQTNKYLSVP